MPRGVKLSQVLLRTDLVRSKTRARIFTKAFLLCYGTAVPLGRGDAQTCVAIGVETSTKAEPWGIKRKGMAVVKGSLSYYCYLQEGLACN